ncbi:H-NS family nucleoid-associated regulatory protein [Burkholderia sp. Ac-20365]|uniref:H-NS family nucleoid-associated regulatory protein n=1 Tax=Burkholderia sp. Ac-20365 TaxID=2703897 RepID=UPI00197B34FD|nr:H-NS family nucleoid-associated regulatory protein [Burkholderia sp. Ac-20365]MBN3761275.1 H-NS histone family protein [Burkholderia sp. Ac-20365]
MKLFRATLDHILPSMATYLQLLAERRDLDEKIKLARPQAAREALEAARAAIAEFGFTPADLFGKPKKKKKPRVRAPNDQSTVDTRTMDLFE